MKRILAIDPGKNGGFAIGRSDGVWATAFKMPASDGDIAQELMTFARQAIADNHECVAVIEDLVKFAGKNTPGASAIVYGRNHGFIEGVLTGLGIRIERVRAQEWQKALGLGSSNGTTKTAWKNKLKSMAQRLYPELNINGDITLATADAILILEWAVRKEKGQLI